MVMNTVVVEQMLKFDFGAKIDRRCDVHKLAQVFKFYLLLIFLCYKITRIEQLASMLQYHIINKIIKCRYKHFKYIFLRAL